MELLNGRPADEAGRLEKEIRVYDLLDSLGISYQRVDHEPAMTIEACQDIDKLMGTPVSLQQTGNSFLSPADAW